MRRRRRRKPLISSRFSLPFQFDCEKIRHLVWLGFCFCGVRGWKRAGGLHIARPRGRVHRTWTGSGSGARLGERLSWPIEAVASHSCAEERPSAGRRAVGATRWHRGVPVCVCLANRRRRLRQMERRASGGEMISSFLLHQ
jgi:hypothetical protein